MLIVRGTKKLPVLLPLAPAATVPSRIGSEIAVTLAAHQSSA